MSAGAQPSRTAAADAEAGESDGGKKRLRPLRLLLYPLFWAALLIPLVRRWRRLPSWNVARTGVGAASLALFVGGLTGRLEWVATAWMLVPAGSLALLSAALGPIRDPDAERELQRRHGADYLLNGGCLLSGLRPGARPLARDAPLYLLIREGNLMIVPRNGLGEVHFVVDLLEVREIRVEGEIYVPVYVSEAKDPPVREREVDRRRRSALELLLDDGERLVFEHQGAFSKHLSETAAHAIFSVRARLRKPTGEDALRIAP